MRRPYCETWVDLKRELRDRFVPTYYAKDLYAKLQRLCQGSKSVEEYHKEIEMGMMKAQILESQEATMIRYDNVVEALSKPLDFPYICSVGTNLGGPRKTLWTHGALRTLEESLDALYVFRHFVSTKDLVWHMKPLGSFVKPLDEGVLWTTHLVDRIQVESKWFTRAIPIKSYPNPKVTKFVNFEGWKGKIIITKELEVHGNTTLECSIIRENLKKLQEVQREMSLLK
ncbi:hypothetical protein CR513_02223, partial [Mucuna pruriens]